MRDSVHSVGCGFVADPRAARVVSNPGPSLSALVEDFAGAAVEYVTVHDCQMRARRRVGAGFRTEEPGIVLVGPDSLTAVGVAAVAGVATG